MDHFVKKTLAEVEDITAEIDKKSEVGALKMYGCLFEPCASRVYFRSALPNR